MAEVLERATQQWKSLEGDDNGAQLTEIVTIYLDRSFTPAGFRYRERKEPEVEVVEIRDGENKRGYVFFQEGFYGTLGIDEEKMIASKRECEVTGRVVDKSFTSHEFGISGFSWRESE